MRLSTLIVGSAAAVFVARLGGVGVDWLPGLGALAVIYGLLALSTRVPDEAVTLASLTALARRHRFGLAVLLLVALTLVIRLPHLSSELGHNPIDIDEHRLAENVRQFFVTGELHHETVEHYPGLVFWLFSAASFALYMRTLSAGRAIPPDAWPVEQFVRAARLANVGVAAGIVIFTALIGRRVLNARAGLAAAALVAVAPLSLNTTASVRNDPGMLLAVLAAVYAALVALESDGLTAIAWSGTCAGVATGIKYSSAFAIVPVLIAATGRGTVESRAKRAAVAALTFAAAIAVTNHFVWADFPNLLRQLSDQIAITGAGHWAASRNPAAMYVNTLSHDALGAALLAMAALFAIAALTRPTLRNLVWLSYPLLYMWFMTRRPSQFARWVFPMLPFVALAAAGAVQALLRWAPRLSERPKTARALRAAAAVAVVAMLVQPIAAAATTISRRFTAPTHTLAERWLAGHVQPGEVVLAEQGWLDLTGNPFTVKRVDDLSRALRDGELAGVTWVVVPETNFGDPGLRGLALVQRFHASYGFRGNAGYDYEIYRVPQASR